MKKFLTFAGILGLLLLLKWSFLGLPFFYEEKPGTIQSALSYSLWDALTLNFHQGAFDGHPPIFPYAASLWARIFGASPFSIHFFMALISAAGLTCLAGIFRELSPFRKNLWWLPVVLILSLPDFFIHSTGYHYDIFTAALGCFYLYSRLRERFWPFLLLGCFLAQTRETALAFLAAVALVDLLKKLKQRRTERKWFIASFIHLLVWGQPFFTGLILKGKASSSEAAEQVVQSASQYFDILGYNLKWFFFDDYRIALSLLSATFLALSWRKGTGPSLNWLYPALVVVFYSFGMAFHIYEASYYLLPAVPLLYALFAAGLTFYPKTPTVLYASLAYLFILAGISLNNEKSDLPMSENGTDYRLVVDSYQQAADYLVLHRDKSINAEWPLVYYLHDPSYGYVKEGVESAQPAFIDHLTPSKKKNVIYTCDEFNPDIIAVASDGNPEESARQLRFAERCGYKVYRTFSNRKSKVDMYKKF